MQAPFYLQDNYTRVPQELSEKLNLPENDSETWVAMLKQDETDWFNIHYYGSLFENRIVYGDAPPLVLAHNIINNQQILLFDEVRHGYDSVIASSNREYLKANRTATEIYKNAEGEDVFQIIVEAHYSSETDGEDELFEEYEGSLEFSKVLGIQTVDELLSVAFDYFTIYAISKTGKVSKILDQELA